MTTVFYRVIEDDFGEEDNVWMIDCIIQTEDSEDFDTFEEALNECLDRIQERIDRQEDAPGDDGYLERLREKLEDTLGAIGMGWGDYTDMISQPFVRDPRERKAREFLDLDSIEALKLAVSFRDEGLYDPEKDARSLATIAKFERLTGVGGGKPKVKPKTFKVRPRPPITFDKVKVSPQLLEELGPGLIRGLLARHRMTWETLDAPYSPLNEAYTYRMGGPDDRVHYYVMTVFLDGTTVTFATVLPRRFPDPDDGLIMDEALVDFDWTDGPADHSRFHPSLN